MTNILEDLKKYLANATQEELDKDWDELKEYNKIGPEVSAFVVNALIISHNCYNGGI